MHQPLTKAMRETEEAIATARIDTRKRRLWSFVIVPKEDIDDNPAEYALTFFQKPSNTPVRIARDSKGACLVAVWDGKEDDPLIEPHDWPPHGMRDDRDVALEPARRRSSILGWVLLAAALGGTILLWWGLR